MLIMLLSSLYLLGFVVGRLSFGNLSECAGCRPVLTGTYLAYVWNLVQTYPIVFKGKTISNNLLKFMLRSSNITRLIFKSDFWGLFGL